MMKSGWYRIALLMLTAALGGGCRNGVSTRDIPAVTGFEVERYMGKWYEIARLPHRFERDVVDASAEYTLRDDGTVKVVNAGFRDGLPIGAEAVARKVGAPGAGEMEVSFFRPFYGAYRIIHLEPDYSAAIVTSDTRDSLWILAREPFLPQEHLTRYLALLERWKFPVRLLQYPSGQVGRMAKE